MKGYRKYNSMKIVIKNFSKKIRKVFNCFYPRKTTVCAKYAKNVLDADLKSSFVHKLFSFERIAIKKIFNLDTIHCPKNKKYLLI
jgi:hypothetical protein